jgi:hypothetical protein
MMQAGLLDRMFVPMAGLFENLGVQVVIEIMPEGDVVTSFVAFFPRTEGRRQTTFSEVENHAHNEEAP